MLVFLLIGGVASDRFPRVPVVLLSDLARGVVMLVVGLPVPFPLILFRAFVNGASLETFSLIWTNTL